MLKPNDIIRTAFGDLWLIVAITKKDLIDIVSVDYRLLTITDGNIVSSDVKQVSISSLDLYNNYKNLTQ